MRGEFKGLRKGLPTFIFLWSFVSIQMPLSTSYVANVESTIYSIIYNDPNVRVYYPRIMEICHNGSANGTLLATCEEYIRQMPVHPIYKSSDKGKTWTRIGEVKDTQHGWGMRFQPMLFELPQAVGNLPQGTILCAGNAIPRDMSKTSIDLYKSNDLGVTWTYMSTVCAGGRASPSGREDPVWEPFLYLDKEGRFVCAFSDERDPAHNQLLGHYVSEDGGYTWGRMVHDVSLGELRPGMPIIAKLPNGLYFMVYEIVRLPGNQIHYKFSNDGLDWEPVSDRGTPITTVDGYSPGGTPYCVWAPVGGPNGMIIVSARESRDPLCGDFAVNYNLGKGNWYRMRTPIRYDGSAGNGYSRSMVVSANGKELYSVVNLPNGQRSRLNMVFYRIPLELAVGWSYKLTAACSFKNLGVENNSDTDGANVKQWSNKEDSSQQWSLQTAGDGYYKLVAKNSGKVLEVENQSTADGAKVVLGQYADRDNQKWKIEYVDDGFYKLTAKHSGKCMSVINGSNAEGADIQQLADNGSDAQKWRMDPVDTQNPWGEWEYVTGL
jgi:hypothetical protein